MLRVLLFGVLSLGAARLVWTLARQPAALDALTETPASSRDGYATFGPLVAHLQEELAADAPVFVLAPDSASFEWIRYLAYPRRIEWLPAGLPQRLQSLPAGASFIVLPLAQAADDASATLRARSGAAQVERVLVHDGDYAVYRVQR